MGPCAKESAVSTKPLGRRYRLASRFVKALGSCTSAGRHFTCATIHPSPHLDYRYQAYTTHKMYPTQSAVLLHTTRKIQFNSICTERELSVLCAAVAIRVGEFYVISRVSYLSPPCLWSCALGLWTVAGVYVLTVCVIVTISQTIKFDRSKPHRSKLINISTCVSQGLLCDLIQIARVNCKLRMDKMRLLDNTMTRSPHPYHHLQWPRRRAIHNWIKRPLWSSLSNLFKCFEILVKQFCRDSNYKSYRT